MPFVLSAYVLISCDLGGEEDVISELKTIEGIKEIFVTFGVYDILVKAEAENIEILRDAIIEMKIRKIPKLRSTLTLMTIAGQE
jgi:DNA-binding Lrp family transcriptional regulator